MLLCDTKRAEDRVEQQGDRYPVSRLNASIPKRPLLFPGTHTPTHEAPLSPRGLCFGITYIFPNLAIFSFARFPLTQPGQPANRPANVEQDPHVSGVHRHTEETGVCIEGHAWLWVTVDTLDLSFDDEQYH